MIFMVLELTWKKTWNQTLSSLGCHKGCDLSGYPTFNGYSLNNNRRSLYELDHSTRDENIVPIPDMGYDRLHNGVLADKLMPGTACSEYQYHYMSINDRLLMEVHSIGIYPDLVVCLVSSKGVCLILPIYFLFSLLVKFSLLLLLILF